MPTAQINGAEIYYEQAGNGPSIILSSGGLQGLASGYHSVMEPLSSRYQVIAYDRRFGGRSRSPLVVQSWDLVCEDLFGLMDHLEIDEAYLGGGSFGAAISLGCAVRRPERVRAIFPSNIAGGVICDSYLSMKLYKSADIAINHGINAVVSAFDSGDQFSPFSPEIAQHDRKYRLDLEGMATEDFAQVMKDTIYALFDAPFLTLGMTENMLRSIRVPTMVMPGENDIHPRRLAELVHRLVPNCQWAEVPTHGKAPDQYSQRVLQFLDGVAGKPR